MNEDKSARYHRLRRRAGVASLLWGTILLVLLLSTGATFAIRDLAESVVRLLQVSPSFGPAAAAAIVGCALIALNEVFAFPLALYGGFVLERRYGLSTERVGRWLFDHLKGLAIGTAFSALALGFVYAALAWFPRFWWVIAACAFLAVAVVLTRLAPVLLLPLFFHFKPLDREPLRRRLVELASRAGTFVMGAFEWRLSDRTRKVNAALAGLGRTRRVIISDTMLNGEYSDDEIEVILAHEIGHHVHGDIWKGIAFEAVLGLAGFYVADLTMRTWGGWLGLQGLADPAGVPLFVMGVAGLSLLFVPVANAVSRAHERRADRFALDLTQNPSAFVNAMRRLGTQNLAEEAPSRVVQMLFYTHPPIRERIRAAEAWRQTFEHSNI